MVVERRDDEGTAERMLRSARWGLVPSWSKKGPSGRPLINARVETAAVKPSFRAAFSRRRAIIPADGYYEWTSEPAGDGTVRKQPYYIHPEDDAGLSMAGLYEQIVGIWRTRWAPEQSTFQFEQAAHAGHEQATHG